MTTDESSRPGHEPPWSDIDLLADFHAGLLDGTPLAEEVITRLASDPGFRDLYDALLAAEPAVEDDLASVAGPEPMPADVAQRLEVVFSPQVTPLRPKRRHTGWLIGGGAVAAGVAVLTGGVVAVGVFTQTTGNQASDSAGGEAPTSAQGPREMAPGDIPPGTEITSSGQDYQVSTLAEQLDQQAAKSDQEATGELDRLTNRSELAECLDLLSNDSPSRVDFARFEGGPALVVTWRRTGTTYDVAIVGPDCGLAGSDLRYRGTVTAR